MKLHSDVLSRGIILGAAQFAGVTLGRIAVNGSRKRVQAFDVTLHGSSSHRPNDRGASGPDAHAATWDEWGVFLGALYRTDPAMICAGGGGYENAEHFNWATGGAFAEPVMPRAMHRQHRWNFTGTNVTGSYHVAECACGAVQRYMASGRTFAELSLV